MTTVLVVDDNPLDQKLAGKCIEAAGWSAEFAQSGHEALEKIQHAPPDIVLTDLQMPEMDGLELVEQLQARFPAIPVVLFTAYGSEELAVTALKAGASSYVPKRNLSTDLPSALQAVLDAVQSRRQRQQLFECLTDTRSKFVLNYDKAGQQALVSYCQEMLRMMNFCDEGEMLRVGMALNEALQNAMDHGNLELSSSLREAEDDSYAVLRQQRVQESPYCERRIHVETFVSRSGAKFVIQDEGPGFDPSSLPDPTAPENLLKPTGRGIMLMRTFMDEVTFNDAGNQITLVRRS